MNAIPKFVVAVAALLITALLVVSIAVTMDASKKGYETTMEQTKGLDTREPNPDRTMDEYGNTIPDPYQ